MFYEKLLRRALNTENNQLEVDVNMQKHSFFLQLKQHPTSNLYSDGHISLGYIARVNK